MKVFISWSGEASKKVAELLRKYLPCMVQDLNPFMSQHDLSSGGRWSKQLSEELENSNFGIVCLTPENLASPWILFEAGALTKHVEGRACCVLFQGLSPADVSGPLSQFQNRVFSREGFEKLIVDINNLLERPLESLSLQLILEKWWPDFDRDVTNALENLKDAPTKAHKRAQSDLLEELLLRVRNIQRSIESGHREESPYGGSIRVEPPPAVLTVSTTDPSVVITTKNISLSSNTRKENTSLGEGAPKEVKAFHEKRSDSEFFE